MATFTSSWRSYGSGAQFRLILEIDDPPASIGSGISGVSLAARLFVQTTSTLSDSSNTNALSGTLGSQSNSFSVSHGSGGGVTQVTSVADTVATVYGSTVTVTVAGSIQGYEAFPSGSPYQAFVQGSVVIPARPYSPPAAPTSVTVTRNSDTSHTVTWTRNPTTAGPYTSQQVLRWDNVTGAYAVVANLSGSAASYTDTSTRADRRYRYAVRAVNSGGNGAYGYSGYIKTTPAAPSGASAAKSGANIVLTWSNRATAGDGVVVERREDGGSWVAAATLGNVETWTHTSPNPAVTHQYRVKATVTGPSLSSGWVESNTVQLAAAPNAPTNLSGPTIRDATEDATWSWTHNPVDSSPQEYYQLRHREVGGSWTTGSKTASATSAYTLPGGTYANPKTVEWEVRTWGQHADPSPWSATATSPTSTRPTVLVNTPEDGSTVATSTITVEWGYSDAEDSPQATWTVELLDAGSTVVETRSGSGTGTSVGLSTVLVDGASYTVRVRVQEAAGLFSAWDSSGFSVAYAVPPTPTVGATWDGDTASMVVSVSVPDPVGDEIAADHVDIYRSIDAGPWVLIATGVPVGSAITDYSPTVAGTTTYRADAVSALPSVATSVPVALVTPQPGDVPSVWVSGGPGFSVVCRAVANIQVQTNRGPAVSVLHRFAGRTSPVLTESADQSLVLTMTSQVFHTEVTEGTASSLAEWEALAAIPGPKLWRDPDGRWLPVHARIGLVRSPGGAVGSVSVTATQIDAD